MITPLRVLEAARAVEDEVNQLIDKGGLRLLHLGQLRDSAEGIPANIREAFGRRSGLERKQYLRVSRSSAEETDEHLRSNFAARRLVAAVYWRLHNRIALVVKMLNKLGADE